MPSKKARKPNKGSFRQGPDPRRHVFTKAERRLGYYRALRSNDFSIDTAAWFYRKIRGYYRAQARAEAG
jgi:hypothetical protein